MNQMILVTTAQPFIQFNPPHDVESKYSELKTSDEEEKFEESASSGPNHYKIIKAFYYNRMRRVLPVYYIALLFAIPYTFAVYGMSINPKNSTTWLALIMIFNIIPINSWLIFFNLFYPVDGPEWTISTLFSFWLLFPYLMKYYSVKTDQDLLNSIQFHFWVQLLIIAIIFPLIFTRDGDLGFWFTTALPLCRLPVFIMGMNAGILCHRYSSEPTMSTTMQVETLPSPQSLPWFSYSGSFMPIGCVNLCSSCDHPSSRQVDFVRTCYFQATSLLTLTLLFFGINSFYVNTISNLWFQGLNVFAQLDLLVALTQVGGTTSLSDVLRSSTWQWFGDISMSMYLIHYTVIFNFCWANNHGRIIQWPSTFDCNSSVEGSEEHNQCQQDITNFFNANTLPYSGLIVVPMIVIPLAAGLFYVIEQPIRKYFK